MVILHNLIIIILSTLSCHIFLFPILPRCKVRTLIKRYCGNLTIKLTFSSFKIKNLIKVKDPVPRSPLSCVAFKFTCAGCNSVYVGETCRHISTRIQEHLFTRQTQNSFYASLNSFIKFVNLPMLNLLSFFKCYFYQRFLNP